MIKLLAIDMDGTCLSDRKCISEENLQALHEAVERGVHVVPTTGRTLTCLPHQIRNQAFFRYVISSNGALLTDTYTGKDLYTAKIPYGTAAAFLRECDREGVGISAHIDRDFVIQGHGLRLLGKLNFGKDAAFTRCSPDIAGMIQENQSDVEEIQLFYFTDEMREKTKELLFERKDFLKAFSDCYVELYAPNASKGTALAALAQHMGIAREEIACIGDAENDLPMFETAGLRMAMGNGIPALKEKADVVLPSNNEHGVAVAIRQFIL